jgi:membrane-associated protein
MLTALLLPFIEYVGYPGIFLIIFAESGTIVGFFLPGASLLFTTGLLAAKGIFNPWILIPGVTIAAILGDNVGYWFGAKVGIRLFEREDSRFFKRKYVRQAHDFYEKHGAKAVILARFVPIARTFVPIVAGIANMNYRVFMICNLVGALLWATGVTSAGYFLGERFPIIQEYITYVILGIVFVTMIPVLRETYKQYKAQLPPQP